MKSILTILFTFALVSILPAAEITEDVATAIKTGSSRDLSNFFGSSIDLTIIETEGVYSKAQAELIMKDFFSKQVPKSFDLIHQGTSKLGLQYAIGTLTTTTGKTFRVSFYIKKSEDSEFIQTLRIDPEE